MLYKKPREYPLLVILKIGEKKTFESESKIPSAKTVNARIIINLFFSILNLAIAQERAKKRYVLKIKSTKKHTFAKFNIKIGIEFMCSRRYEEIGSIITSAISVTTVFMNAL